MAELSNSALSSLIGAIYDCALDPARWDATLADIAIVFACEKVILSLNDIGRNRILIDKSVGWEKRWLEERSKHLAEIHDRLSPWLGRGTPPDQPFVASHEIPEDEAARSPYVRDCLAPLGVVDVAHYCLIATPSHFSELVLARQAEQGAITRRELEIGALLLPHLRRAVTISNVLDVRTVESSRMAEALDAVRHGVLLTNQRGAILHANRSAGRMLMSGGPIQASGGVLRAKYPAANSELRKAITLAAGNEAEIGRVGAAVRLTGTEASPVFARVLPMTGSDLRTRLQPEAVAAIFIDAAPDEEDGAERLAAAFGLTPAETRVAAGLLSGRTLFETASELGIAATTARTHLTSIFGKTGVSRQAELIRLAMRVAPA